jgi:hypothetical protein
MDEIALALALSEGSSNGSSDRSDRPGSCTYCGDSCEAEDLGNDGCLCDTGDCPFCEDGCSGE